MLQNLFKTDEQLVEEIHSEFDAAQENLLREAKKIINSYQVNNKAERLAKIGFTGIDDVVKNEAKKKSIIENKDQADLIEYYKINYPFQKFLTEGELNRICKKYSLVYAPVANYTKDIPEKNLKEIEASPTLKPDDEALNEFKCKIALENFILGFGTWLSMFNPLWWKIPGIIEGNYLRAGEVDEYLKNKYVTTVEYLCDRVIENIEIDKQGLFIAAPKAHFNKKGLSKYGQFGSYNFSITVPKDPIVFRYCKGGAQVLSKWGIEGKDEGLTNEIYN